MGCVGQVVRQGAGCGGGRMQETTNLSLLLGSSFILYSSLTHSAHARGLQLLHFLCVCLSQTDFEDGFVLFCLSKGQATV